MEQNFGIQRGFQSWRPSCVTILAFFLFFWVVLVILCLINGVDCRLNFVLDQWSWLLGEFCEWCGVCRQLNSLPCCASRLACQCGYWIELSGRCDNKVASNSIWLKSFVVLNRHFLVGYFVFRWLPVQKCCSLIRPKFYWTSPLKVLASMELVVEGIQCLTWSWLSAELCTWPRVGLSYAFFWFVGCIFLVVGWILCLINGVCCRLNSVLDVELVVGWIFLVSPCS